MALRNHSPYSLLEGSIKILDLIQAARQYNMPALGLADTGHLFGAMDFSLTCQKNTIHPLIGCQIMVSNRGQKLGSVVLYVQNQEGYSNLCRLVSATTVGVSEQRMSIDIGFLARHTKGLLMLTGGMRGPIDRLLRKKKMGEAKDLLSVFCDIFPDHLYIELQRYEKDTTDVHLKGVVSQQRCSAEPWLLDKAYAMNIPIVATNTAFFLSEKDYEAYKALRCVALGSYLHSDHQDQDEYDGPLQYFRSPHDMMRLFSDVPEAIDNTQHVMKRCAFLLEKKEPQMPHFPCDGPEERTLNRQSHQGLESRLQQDVCPVFKDAVPEDVRTQYMERLNYELKVINDMGFAGYFLIVSDFIRWAKRHNIPVGPGRGSGAGSLVAWSLQITDIDPIRFGLVFERFLNPERVSMPDFDVDFCQDRRDEVIRYVYDKYGPDHVAHIITFGTLQARAALRDVGRVLHMPYPQIDKICKMIPNNPAQPLSLKEAIEVEPRLQEMRDDDGQVSRLMDISLKLEGLYRHASTHAAGVVISAGPLQDVVPLYQDEGSALPATEFSMKYAESAGLVKFDFLGLKTLTVLQTVVDLLKDRDVALVLSQISLDDRATFDLLCRADVLGLFQLESAGMKDLVYQLKPKNFNEIIAIVALYRPGPMENIPRYLACRSGEEAVKYDYSCLKDILSETYGVMIYQEQVLKIAQVLAGYSLGSADLLRRAMGKKIQSEMDAQRELFVQGVLEHNGGDAQTASHLFDQISKFAGYAFNKAHSAGYALISYQTAYCKANYFVEFMTALLIHDMHNTDKIRLYHHECQRMGVIIFPPDVNASQSIFAIEGQNIRYGLAALKGVGCNLTDKIVAERQKKGLFKDIFDFVNRTLPLGMNKKALESLIAAGALDRLYKGSKSTLMASIDVLLRQNIQSEKQSVLFHVEKPALKEVAPWSVYEAFAYELNALGFYLTGHPLDTYTTQFFTLFKDVKESLCGKDSFAMVGIVLDVTERLSKAGKKFALVRFSDPSGDYDGMVFSDLLDTYRSDLVQGSEWALQVTARFTGEGVRIQVKGFQMLSDFFAGQTLSVPILSTDKDLLKSIMDEAQPGLTDVQLTTTLSIQGKSLCVILNTGQKIRLTPCVRSDFMALKARNEKDNA